MGMGAATGAKFIFNEYDLSGQITDMGLEIVPEMVDPTTLPDATRLAAAGLLATAFSAEGQYEAGLGLLDEGLYEAIGVDDKVISAIAPDGTEGSVVYFFQANMGIYKPIKNAIGELLGFTVEAAGRSKAIRGTLGGIGAKTATGNGAAYQMGAVGAAEYLYAALHVYSISGTTPTIDVKIQSDNVQGFGTPTDQITFAQVTTTKTAIWATRVAGVISDDWWRATWTISGGSPSYGIAVVMGIL